MVTRIAFQDQINRNKLKSVILMIAVIGIIILVGYVISLAVHPSYFFVIMIFAIIFSLGYTYYGFYNSDKIALASVGARPASESHYRDYHNSVEGLCIASGLPKPRLYVMKGEQINAFASGRDPKNAVICVTEGCLHKLDKHEFEGVLAHELAHIANFDIRFMTLITVLVGMVAIISQIFLRSLWFSGGGDRDNKNVIFIIIGIVLAILAPIVVSLIQLAVSRKREFVADAHGVKLTRYPKGLRNALEKIKHDKPMKTSKATASLFFSDPFKKKVQNLFSTHPDVDERIKILDRM